MSNKYKVETTKISCRVETDKLEQLKAQYGVTTSQLIDQLINEKLKVSDRLEENREIDISYLASKKEKGITSFNAATLKSCEGDLICICNIIRDYNNILQKKLDTEPIEGFARANMEHYIQRHYNIYEKLSTQLGYDWDQAIEKCYKSNKKDRSQSADVGEDALNLFAKGKKNIS